MDHDPNSRMGDVIRAAFQKSGLSIKKLAERSRVPYASVHATIVGERDPLLSTADKLCRVLELELVPKRRKKRRE
jgi:ribosome-binding protein aMBF1 (putative translation factor)